VIGTFTDFFQRTITDVDATGPDRARGGSAVVLRHFARSQRKRTAAPEKVEARSLLDDMALSLFGFFVSVCRSPFRRSQFLQFFDAEHW
jgi:hypothetical protein